MRDNELVEWRGDGLAAGARDVVDGYDVWTSPVVSPGFPVAEVVPSWDVDTPTGTSVLVEARLALAGGRTSHWYDLGRWRWSGVADDTIPLNADIDPPRTSRTGQDDADGRVATDVLVAADPPSATGWQVRVTSRGDGVVVRSVAAVASSPDDGVVTLSEPSGRASLVDVPRFSQETHRGHHPEYDGGGEAWCSPTSVAMLLAHYGRTVPADELAWVRPEGHEHPEVDHAARATYDVAYRGCGNWAFNTAYAATFGLDATLTRLRDLAQAEAAVAAGVPLALSVSFAEGELDGAGYVTAGHLLVLVGFTAEGDPVVNDPAAATDDAVRRTYPRAQLERAWLRGSGGLSYVVREPGARVPLPGLIG